MPSATDRVNVNLISGLVKTTTDIDQNTVWVINATELCIETNTFIPNTDYMLNYQEVGSSSKSTINSTSAEFNKPGILPMALAAGSFKAIHTITLTGPDGSCQLKAVPRLANSPKAVWGSPTGSASGNTADSSGSLVPNTLKGFQLVPAQEPKSGVTHPVCRNSLAWELSLANNAYQDMALTAFSGTVAPSVDQYILGSNAARNAVLTALGLAETSIPDAETLKNNLNFTFTPGLINGSYGNPA